MAVSTEAIKALRGRTGAGIMDCRKVLEEVGGDIERALLLLKAKGLAKAAGRAERETRQGLVETYVHPGGRIGALVELNCETDFVARTEEFKKLAHDLAMQVTAMNPRYISEEQAPPGVDGHPEELFLLRQACIKDPGKLVGDLVTELAAKTGENIRVRRFVRFALGEGEE